jgi:acid phosphatase type 7
MSDSAAESRANGADGSERKAPVDVPVRPGRARPRTVLLWVVIAIAIALGLRAAAPWLLPVRIYEGPLVQMASSNSVTLVWYTTRPAACTVSVTFEGRTREIPSAPEGRCHSVRIDDLLTGTTYSYEIRCGSRPLTAGLAFQTNRPSGAKFSFIVFGDSGKASRGQYALAADMSALEPRPDFLLHTGDLVYPDGARERYEERFFAPYRALLSRVAFWPCLGNHDLDDSGIAAAYTEVFDVPRNGPPGTPAEHNYWFDYGNCRFVVLDTEASEATLRDCVAPWLERTLQGPDLRWRFVAFHVPPYTGGKYAPNPVIQRTLVPALEAGGADLVFNGHDHNYQRTAPLRGGELIAPGDGVVYVITGAGGGQLYSPEHPRPAYLAAGTFDQYSFTQVVVTQEQVEVRQIAQGQKEIDRFVLRKAGESQGD